MRKVFLHIYAVSAAVILCLACSADKASVIPRGKLARIYAEMLVMDQWVISETEFKRIADTSLVYEPIFRKYGYDTEDYRKSVAYYMNDPERYSRILRETAEILDARINELAECKKALARKHEIESFVTDFNIAEYYPYLSEEPYVHYYDSLSVEPDSGAVYRIVSIERADTIYDLLRMVIRTDSLAVDTLDVEQIEEKVDSKSDEKQIPDKVEQNSDEVGLIEFPEQKIENVVMKPKKFEGKTRLMRHSKLDSVKIK